MKKMGLILLGVALFLAGAAVGRLTDRPAKAESVAVTHRQTGQQSKYDPKDPATWPASLDALAAAPNNHKVLLENERVRVLEVVVRPGESEPLHAHRWPGVFYTDAPAYYRMHDGEGKVLFDTRTREQPSVSRPRVIWLDPQAPHWVENYGELVHRAIRVELKP
jgi:mannose-6-phosphate isomerase-like protein (cupin superfamily)